MLSQRIRLLECALLLECDVLLGSREGSVCAQGSWKLTTFSSLKSQYRGAFRQHALLLSNACNSNSKVYVALLLHILWALTVGVCSISSFFVLLKHQNVFFMTLGGCSISGFMFLVQAQSHICNRQSSNVSQCPSTCCQCPPSYMLSVP